MSSKRAVRKVDNSDRLLAERIGRALRRWRTEQVGATRGDLAGRLGISLSTLERLENGRTDLRVSHLMAMEGICTGALARVYVLLIAGGIKPDAPA